MTEPDDDLIHEEVPVGISANHEDGRVEIHFLRAVHWLSIPTVEARGLAALLIEKSDELDRRPS